MKKAKETIGDIERKNLVGWESQVGSHKMVVNGKVLKSVVIRMTH